MTARERYSRANIALDAAHDAYAIVGMRVGDVPYGRQWAKVVAAMREWESARDAAFGTQGAER